MIYLDANSTHPPREEIFPILEKYNRQFWQNPSGLYARFLRQKIEEARLQVAQWLGAEKEEIIFTSGATESNNTSLFSFAEIFSNSSKKKVLIGSIEHSSIEAIIPFLENRGFQVERIPINCEGLVDFDSYQKILDDDVAFISHCWVNSEIGTFQAIEKMGFLAQERKIPFHIDGVAGLGKIPIQLSKMPIDAFSFSGHKLGAGKGVGGLYIRSGLRFFPLLRGGGQEKGKRSGTENVPAILSLGEVARVLSQPNFQDICSQVEEYRNQFEEYLLSSLEGVVLNGHQDFRVQNTSNLSFSGCDATGLVILLAEKGLACSAGSACMAGSREISSTFQAMKIDEERAKSSVRFSFPLVGNFPWKEAAELVKKMVEKFRSVQGKKVGPVFIHPFQEKDET